jgi:hypothetical protein
MALIRPITVNDIEYPAAYSRITTIRADKADAYVYVCTYADEAARMADAFPIFAEEHVAPMASLTGDLFPKAYEFIKTCPGFEAATDHPFVDPAEVVEPAPEPVPKPTPEA